MGDEGQRAATVKALFRHERLGPSEFSFIQVRELDEREWGDAIAAHVVVHGIVHSFDRFLSFAWQDLQATRQDAIKRAIPARDSSIGSLLEYRVLGYSTALWLYDQYVTAEVNRRGDEELRAAVRAIFSATYDASPAYRLVFSLRNAFQHGVRNVVKFRGSHGLVDPDGTETFTTLRGTLVRQVFVASHANAAVRKEVQAMDDDPDVLTLCDAAYVDVQRLHVQIAPLLYPEGPAAARLLMGYMHEIGNMRAHFHEYPVGEPLKPVITSLSPGGFDWVVREAGEGSS